MAQLATNPAPSVAGRRQLLFFGLPFENVNMEQLTHLVEHFIGEGRPIWMTEANAAVVAWCHRGPQLRELFASADVVLGDGMAMMYASRLLGNPLPEMLSGPLVLDRLVQLAAERGHSVYFLGAQPELLRLAIARYQERFPSLIVAGSRDGYFSADDEKQVVADIRRCQPRILFVAMGSPREERFLRAHRAELAVPVCLDVGGAFDVAAGVYRLAPMWMRTLALEWLYRLIQEPRRLWRRYLSTNVTFLALLAGALVSRYLRRGDAR